MGRGGEAVEGVMDGMDAPRMAEDVEFGTAAQEAVVHGRPPFCSRKHILMSCVRGWGGTGTYPNRR